MAIMNSFKWSIKDKKGEFKLKILQNNIFWGGLCLKIILSFFFAGAFMKDYFIPFVSYFWDSGFENPYEFFFNSGTTDVFPYPPLMLYILTFFGGFWADISPFFIRIPLLLADIGILILLSRLLKGMHVKLLWYYWFSPVLIYITYIHGQLDVIPIMFLIGSAYLLFKKKYLLSAFILGLGIATKTNLILIIPFYIIYLLKNNNEKRFAKLLIPSIVAFVTVLLCNLPYLWSNPFLKIVYANSEQAKIWQAGIPFQNNIYYYVIPAAYLVLLAVSTRFKHISKDLFLMFIGFSFSVLLIFIPPQPGWYFWIIPFFIYFNIKERKLTFMPIIILQIAFLLYFAIISDSDFLSVYLSNGETNTLTLFEFLKNLNLGNPERMVNVVFTILQTCLILNVYWIYKWGIKKNLEKKIKNKPFLIGVGGDSGVGKSTLTQSLISLFGTENITVIRGDDMHRWERGHDKWGELTHLSPKANHLHEEIQQLKQLKSGKKILRRLYDHSTGKFTEPLKVYPNKIIVFEGLHPFYISAKRNLFDLKVFVSPNEDLRLHWKISRDIIKRGYTKEKVLEQLKLREEDSKKYIRSQAQFSDIKLSYYTVDKISDVGNNEELELALRIELETNIDINDFIDKLTEQTSLKLSHEYGINNQVLDVDGVISKNKIEKIVYNLITDYDEFIEGVTFEKDLNGFIQLFFLYCIVQRAKND